ncbi:MAG TPA: hypothetical protein VHX86_09805 [Tepidisphaeraceae bacterium]|nr:hypothetical protein [Tepidisphaeraceae bacterium]
MPIKIGPKMNYFLLIGCVLCGWAMLRVIGDERAHLVKELDRRLRREARAAPVPPPSPAEAAPPPPKQPAPAAKGKH